MHLRLLLMLLLSSMYARAQNFNLFIGTYTNTNSKGIYVYRFNAATGNATLLSHTDSAPNPSFVALSPNQKYLYATSETGGAMPGQISAYSFNKKTGRLTFINHQPSGGDGPCHVSVHKSNNWVMAANYGGGSASVFKVKANGALAPYSQLMQDTGKSVNPQRQDKPHVHAAVFSPDNNFVFTPDLGLDKIMAYRFNAAASQPLKPALPSFAPTQPGSGPRHITFHPNTRYAYLIEEMTGTVTAFRYEAGKLSPFQRLEAHPADFTGTIGSADIHISPDGKFLYASNRGDENTLAIFEVNQNTGRLTARGYQSTMGKTPRNFAIDPTGNFLLVANQATDNIFVFKRNKVTGKLTPTGVEIKVPNLLPCHDVKRKAQKCANSITPLVKRQTIPGNLTLTCYKSSRH